MAPRDATEALIEKLTAMLAETNERLAAMQAELIAQREASAAREADLRRQLEEMTKRAFGKRTEKMPRPKDAMRKVDKSVPDPKRRTDKRLANAAARAALPTEIETHAVPRDARTCPSCGDGSRLRPLGEGRSTTEYDYVPGYFR